MDENTRFNIESNYIVLPNEDTIQSYYSGSVNLSPNDIEFVISQKDRFVLVTKSGGMIFVEKDKMPDRLINWLVV